MDNEQVDRFITAALARSECEVPAGVRAQIAGRVAAGRSEPDHAWRRLLPWLPLLAAAALVVAFSLPVLVPPRAAEKKITQIRTEFDLPDHNIRIVWVQRDDFRLGSGEG